MDLSILQLYSHCRYQNQQQKYAKDPLQKTKIQVQCWLVTCWKYQFTKANSKEEEYVLYKRYQQAVHGDKDDEITEESYTHFLVDSPLITATLPGLTLPGNVSKYGSYRINLDLIYNSNCRYAIQARQ